MKLAEIRNELNYALNALELHAEAHGMGLASAAERQMDARATVNQLVDLLINTAAAWRPDSGE